jgi:thiol-disulfide isomerase/thioredoxin
MAEPTQPQPERTRVPEQIVFFALVFLLLLNLFWMLQNCQRMGARTGDAAPDFSVPQLAGGTFRLSEKRGQVTFVDFWATWCGPCKQSLPILDQVYQAYKDRGVAAIAVETDGAEELTRAFVEALHLTLPIGMGGGEVSRRYGVDTIPHLVLIDRAGKVRRVFRGVHSAAELKRAAEELLAQ